LIATGSSVRRILKRPALILRQPPAQSLGARHRLLEGYRLTEMGRLLYSMSVSLDGFVETPSRSLDWLLVDEELHAAFNEEAREMSAFLYGRRMYELMADYWPTAEADATATPAMREFAAIWRDTPKVVFSRTLGQVAWNSRLVAGDAAAEVARLKAEPGFDMDIGGPTIAAELMRHGLIDELRLYVHPVILGSGTPFFPPLAQRIGLTRLDTRTFGSGVVLLRYATGPGDSR
jgi:dihydrofolate reductase